MKIETLNKSSKKQIVIGVILLILVLCSLRYLYVDYVAPSEFRRMVLAKKDSSERKISIQKKETLDCELPSISEPITSFSLMFALPENKENISMEVAFVDGRTQETIKKWNVKGDEIAVLSPHIFELDSVLIPNENNNYKIIIKNRSETSISLFGSEKNEANYKDDAHEKKDTSNISYIIYGKTSKAHIYLFYAMGAGLILLIALVTIMLWKKKKSEQIFVFVALILGIIYMFLIPPYVVPDEEVHFNTVYAKSSILMGENAYDKNNNVLARKCDVVYQESIKNTDNMLLTKDNYNREMKGFFNGKKVSAELNYSFGKSLKNGQTTAYIPQIVGVIIGRIMNVNAVQLFMLGRFVALLAYIYLVYWSIKLIPFAKMMVFGIAVLPIVMQQSVSYNYDSTIIGLGLWIVSYMIHLIYEKEKIEKKDIIMLGLASIIFSPIKVIYFLLFGLGILIPYKKFGSKKKKYISAVVLVLCGTLSIIALQLSKIGYMASNAEVSMQRTSEAGYTLEFLLQNPLQTIGMFYKTLEWKGDFYFGSAIGSALGYLDFGIANILVTIFAGLLCLSILKVEQEKYQIKKMERLVMILISVGIILATLLALLLDFTSISSTVIEGVQGRYFIPIIPLVLLACRNSTIILKRNIQNFFVWGFIAAEIWSVLMVFRVAMWR